MSGIVAVNVLVPVIVVLLISVCGEDVQPDLEIFNNTDSSFCYFETRPVEGVCPEVSPRSKTMFRGECSGPQPQPMEVVLITAAGRQEIYRRTALCKEWKESNTLIIEQQGDQIIVTDSLPDS